MLTISDAELESLLSDIESDRVERKESLDGDAPKKLREAICAFANDLPGHGKAGVAFVGVNDAGKPTGLEISDRLLQQLADMRSDGSILPIPTMTVEKRRLLGHDVAVVLVAPADAPPVTSGPTEIRTRDYPVEALDQLVRNAVMHRTYEGTHAPVRVNWFSDRIEILSPGGPYGVVNSKNFGRPGITDYRNPTLAEAMKTLGFVQRFGVGIATARRALAENKNPPLEWEVDDRNVLAVVRRRG